MDWMVHYSRRKSVIAHHVGDDALFLHYIAVDYARTREEPVAEILLVETWCQVELVQILDCPNRNQRKTISIFGHEQSFSRDWIRMPFHLLLLLLRANNAAYRPYHNTQYCTNRVEQSISLLDVLEFQCTKSRSFRLFG